MNNQFAALALLSLAAATASAESLVDGSVEAAQAKAVVCGACHGIDGNSVNPQWPNLAGQHARYSYEQLQAFKDGKRADPLMTAQAMALSDEEMRDLSVYYEAQPPAARAVSDASLVDKGESIYRGGIAEKGVAACIACHGPTGKGNPAAAYPDVSGQYAVYAAKQLRDYASGARTSDGPTRMMRDIASRLTEDEIRAVSSYLQGLH
ncbi:MAG: c-type cytochrome [Woeseiaceae bacterium]|nr:c-type cytochrome [Woeseiaceae bacterium]